TAAADSGFIEITAARRAAAGVENNLEPSSGSCCDFRPLSEPQITQIERITQIICTNYVSI
ncbi:MAG: hypothetical protein ABIA92_01255, partial [Patescibacteria group bacterium]